MRRQGRRDVGRRATVDQQRQCLEHPDLVADRHQATEDLRSQRVEPARAERAVGPSAGSPLREVLRPPLLSRTILGVTLGAIPVVGSAANANWLVPWTDAVQQSRAPEGQPKKAPDPRQKAMTQITRSGGAVFGSLLGGVVASALGRRLSYFLISLGALAVSS